jgi:citrate lyase synthetase
MKVNILWRKSSEEKGINGSDIRKRILNNLEWRHLVPKATYDVIKRLDLQQQFK